MAKIDITKIEGYAGMTPEQKIAALEAFEFEDNSSELERYKNALTKANSEAAEWKRKHNDKLSEEEQQKQASEEELTALRNTVAALQKERTVAENKAHYLSLGYDDALASDTAKAMADGDTAKIFANHAKFLETHNAKLKAELLKTTPKPPAGEGGNAGRDYQKDIDTALSGGDFTTAATLIRQQAEQSKGD